jgi:AmmeMemoRadiSam system protein B
MTATAPNKSFLVAAENVAVATTIRTAGKSEIPLRLPGAGFQDKSPRRGKLSARTLRMRVYVLLAVLHLLALQTFARAEQRLAGLPSLYSAAEPFLMAIEAERLTRKPELKVTGIAVPHHLLAADLIARGFWATSGNSYRRIIILSPDHFRRSRRPLATTRRDIDTPLGAVRNDQAATGALLSNAALFDDSDLFEREHGIAALLPFVKYFFPDVPVIPIAISYGSTPADWDAAVAMLASFAGPDTLIVQSTDYSHYLPQEIAVHRDQETLNVIAANDIAAVKHLLQPDHMDSKGAQYIQMSLQTTVGKARGIVIANRSSSEYSAMGNRTTSYIVTVYSTDPKQGAKLKYDDQDVIYFGGDTFIGRGFLKPLADPDVARFVTRQILAVTGGAPMIVNLEGVLLDELPANASFDLHMMHGGLAVSILQAINVKAASLANNHSDDFGENGVRSSEAILAHADIKPLGHMKVVEFDHFSVVAVNFIGVRDYKGYPVVKSLADLSEVCQMKARSPLIALAHWGAEYTHEPRRADYAAARVLHTCGVDVVVGAHTHEASAGVEAMQGGEYQLTFSLGNLLFDQRGDRASSALLEMRLFKQGSYATRLVPLPNLFELATSELARKGSGKRAD